MFGLNRSSSQTKKTQAEPKTIAIIYLLRSDIENNLEVFESDEVKGRVFGLACLNAYLYSTCFMQLKGIIS